MMSVERRPRGRWRVHTGPLAAMGCSAQDPWTAWRRDPLSNAEEPQEPGERDADEKQERDQVAHGFRREPGRATAPVTLSGAKEGMFSGLRSG